MKYNLCNHQKSTSIWVPDESLLGRYSTMSRAAVTVGLMYIVKVIKRFLTQFERVRTRQNQTVRLSIRAKVDVFRLIRERCGLATESTHSRTLQRS